MDVRDPDTGTNYIDYDISHPYTDDLTYVNSLANFFRTDVILTTDAISEMYPDFKKPLILPMRKWFLS